MVLTKQTLKPVTSPIIYLDPDEAQRAKIQKAQRYHTVLIPLYRVVGFGFIAIFVLLHNLWILPEFSWSDFRVFLTIYVLYVSGSWAVLWLFYHRVKRVDLDFILLTLDMVPILLAIYFSGGDKSWLFYLIMARTADQTHATFRKALFFAHLGTLAYVLLLVYLAYVEQRVVAWPSAAATTFFIYATSMYLALISKAAEDLRKRLTAAIRVARSLITERQQAEEALRRAHDELEHRVAERTAELSRANATLHEQVAARHRTEEELLKARKMESIGVLAGGIAHDFNNFLTAILGNISLAQLTVEKDTALRPLLAEAEKACQRATDLTQQLLTFATGGAPIRQTAAIADLVKESVSFVLRGSKVKCDLTIPDDLWPADVDAGQMHQVISNVVLNAEQAMPAGGILQVRAQNATLPTTSNLPLSAGRYVQVTFTDQGCGIPQEHLGNIFDPYFTTKETGIGLGLATAYAIMQKHEGHITVDSTVGRGTTFMVYLPASHKTLVMLPSVSGRPTAGRKKVLVMDDEDAIRDLVGAMLERLGYETAGAPDGAEALRLYQQAHASGQPFDVVILDLTVPGGMGGQDAVAHLSTLEPNVRAIVSSGYSNDPVMANFQHYGFCGVVTKPYTVAELSGVLQHVLCNNGS